MVNPGGFTGLRRQFLDAQQDLYAAAVKGKHIADAVADIQRRYFKRFPLTLSHSEEPTQESLDAVDDDEPDPEMKPPELDGLEPDARAHATRMYEFRIAELKMRKEQIKRRLQYQYNKAQGQKAKFEVGSDDPMAILTAQLTGSTLQKPRQRTAYNIWGPENRCFVDPVFNERVQEGGVPARQQAALRSAIYRELFSELPDEERREWAERAEREHSEALVKFNKTLKKAPSTKPEDRQRIIECISRFVQPIIDLLADHSGWKISLIAGGPEPADGGRLHMLSVHSGATSGAVQMNFGRSERVAYKDVIVPIFARFLRKCYSVQECRDRALPNQSDFTGLAGIEREDGSEVHILDDSREDDEHVRIAGPSAVTPSAPSSAKPSAKSSSNTKPSAAAKGKLPLQIKFGPPKNTKKPETAASSAVPTLATAAVDDLSGDVCSAALHATYSSKALNDGGWISRGPTPPISRAPTPVSSVNCSTPSAPSTRITAAPETADGSLNGVSPARGFISAALINNDGSTLPSGAQLASATELPAVPTPMRSASMEPATAPRPAVVPRRARSVQPTPPNWVGFSSPASNTPSAESQAMFATRTSTPPHAAPVESENAPYTAAAPSAAASTQSEPINPAESTSTFAAAPLTELRMADMEVNDALPPPPGSIAVPSAQDLDTVQEQKIGRKRKGAVITGSHSKQRKTSSRTSPSSSSSGDDANAASSASTPSSGPSWFTNAHKLFNTAALGSEWALLVSNWVRFEEDAQFQGGGKLGTQRRPRVVADWIQRARSPVYRPAINDVAGFATDFSAWWQSLQPEWRRTDSDAGPDLPRQGGDWTHIRRSGANGLLSVVAALFFWGNVVQGTPARAVWLKAMEDVLFVFNQLL